MTPNVSHKQCKDETNIYVFLLCFEEVHFYFVCYAYSLRECICYFKYMIFVNLDDCSLEFQVVKFVDTMYVCVNNCQFWYIDALL